MGDRCYTRFSIPLSALSTAQRRHTTAAALSLSEEEVTAVCAEDPTANTPVADYVNDIRARLVDGVPCLVFEDDECNYAGSSIEDDLQAAGIPFLRFNLAGGTYGPSRSAFVGSGDNHWTDCDADGHPVIRVDVIAGHAAIDPEAVAEINALLIAERRVLHPA